MSNASLDEKLYESLFLGGMWLGFSFRTTIPTTVARVAVVAQCWMVTDLRNVFTRRMVETDTSTTACSIIVAAAPKPVAANSIHNTACERRSVLSDHVSYNHCALPSASPNAATKACRHLQSIVYAQSSAGRDECVSAQKKGKGKPIGFRLAWRQLTLFFQRSSTW